MRVLYELEFRAFFAVVFSFALVLIFGRRTIAFLKRQKIGDAPEFYNADVNRLMESKAATPTMGGVLIVGSEVPNLLQPHAASTLVVSQDVDVALPVDRGTPGFRATSCRRELQPPGDAWQVRH